VPFRASESLVGYDAPPLPLPGVLTTNSAPYHPRIQRARAGCSQSELLASPRPQVPPRPSRPEAQPCLYRTVTRGDGLERPDRRGDEHGTRDDATGTRLFVATPRSRARGQERRPRIVRSRGVGLRRCPIHRSAWKGVSTATESPARNLLLRGSGRPGTRGVLQRRTREHSGGPSAWKVHSANFACTAFSEVAPDFVAHHTIPVVTWAKQTSPALEEGGQKKCRSTRS
jgi:hypothetical protein